MSIVPATAALPLAAPRRLKLSALAASSGAVAGLTFVYPPLYVLAWVAFVPLLFALRGATPLQAYALGLIAGLLMHVVGAYWLVAFIGNLKDVDTVSSVAIATVFWVYSAHLVALAALIYRWLQRRTGCHETLLWPLVLVAAFALFPLPIGIKLGQTQSAFTLALQGIDVTGVYGLDGLIALVNSSVFVLLARAPSRADRFALATTAIIASAWFGYGAFALSRWDARNAAASQLRVGIVQPNDRPSATIPEPRPGFSDAYPFELAITRELARQDVQLVVWPEARYRGYFDRPLVRSVYQRELRQLPAAVLFQDMEHVHTEARALEFNSAALVANGALVDRYRKVERIAFGEYLPLIEKVPALHAHATHSLGAFFATIEPGEGPKVLASGALSIVPLICYETTAAGYVARAVAGGAAQRVIVAMSNDSWFGATRAGHQHLHSSVLRAVENRVPLVHAINNGPSGVVDASGRIRFESRFGVAGGFVASVPYTGADRTFFSRHPRVFIGAVLAILLAASLVAAFKPQRSSTP